MADPVLARLQNLPKDFKLLGAMNADKVVALIEGSRLLADLQRPDVKILATYVRPCALAIGAKAFVEGERAGFLCLVTEGKLHVLKDGDAGSKKLAEIGPGYSVGEMSIIDGMPNSATVVAAQSTTVLVLTRDDLHRIVEEHPRLAATLVWKLGQVVSQRLRQTSGKLIDLL